MKLESLITEKLSQAFTPTHLEVVNESHGHNVPKGSETHFKVVLVAESMTGKRSVQRHQAVYAVLSEAFKMGLHALALHTYNPEEWANASVPQSPECMGGSKN